MTSAVKIGYHIRERFVERVWGLNPTEEYIYANSVNIDKDLLEMLDDSFVVFEKPHIKENGEATMRAIRFHRKSGNVIIMDSLTNAFVTMFEPRLPSIPAALRTKDLVAKMANEIAAKSSQVRELYSKTEKENEDLIIEREKIVLEIEKLKASLEQVEKQLDKRWTTYNNEEQKVIELGNYFIDDRSVKNEKKTTVG